MAVATGEASSIIVVDFDKRHGGFETLLDIEEKHGHFPETVEVRTGGGGTHLYYRYPVGYKIGSRIGWMQGVDIKATGGYVLMPPSNHVDGKYTWAEFSSPTEIELADVPGWLLPLLPRQEEEKPANEQPHADDGENVFTIDGYNDLLRRASAYVAKASAASEGNRNDAAFRLAGHVAAFGLKESDVFTLMVGWNLRNNPPLAEEELRMAVASGMTNGTPRDKKESDAGNGTDNNANGDITFARITSAELAGGDYSVDYLIEHTLVAGQPLLVAGAMKTLKTTLLIDAAISLGSAGYFLGKLKANRPCRVAVMSGESGMQTIQETAIRVCDSAMINLSELGHVVWSPDIPKFGSPHHLTALDRFLSTPATRIPRWAMPTCSPVYESTCYWDHEAD